MMQVLVEAVVQALWVVQVVVQPEVTVVQVQEGVHGVV
jgi:hypothetical protein